MQNIRFLVGGLLALVKGLSVNGRIVDANAENIRWRLDIDLAVPSWLQLQMDETMGSRAPAPAPAPAPESASAPASEPEVMAPALESAPAPAPVPNAERPTSEVVATIAVETELVHDEPESVHPEPVHFDGQMYFPR